VVRSMLIDDRPPGPSRWLVPGRKGRDARGHFKSEWVPGEGMRSRAVLSECQPACGLSNRDRSWKSWKQESQNTGILQVVCA